MTITSLDLQLKTNVAAMIADTGSLWGWEENKSISLGLCRWGENAEGRECSEKEAEERLGNCCLWEGMMTFSWALWSQKGCLKGCRKNRTGLAWNTRLNKGLTVCLSNGRDSVNLSVNHDFCRDILHLLPLIKDNTPELQWTLWAHVQFNS